MERMWTLQFASHGFDMLKLYCICRCICFCESPVLDGGNGSNGWIRCIAGECMHLRVCVGVGAAGGNKSRQ
jgi:hypothetical protein